MSSKIVKQNGHKLIHPKKLNRLHSISRKLDNILIAINKFENLI